MTNSFKIVIDGNELDHSPGEYSPEEIYFGSEKRNLDGSLDSQYYKTKYRFSLSNTTITQWETLMRIGAKRSKTVDYRDSTYLMQTFNGDGSTVQFDLNRKAYTGATAKAWIDDVLKTVTFTTATNPTSTDVFINDATGTVTCGVTPTDANDNIEIYYQPIYQVKIKQILTYLHSNVKSYQFVCEEV